MIRAAPPLARPGALIALIALIALPTMAPGQAPDTAAVPAPRPEFSPRAAPVEQAQSPGGVETTPLAPSEPQGSDPERGAEAGAEAGAETGAEGAATYSTFRQPGYSIDGENAENFESVPPGRAAAVADRYVDKDDRTSWSLPGDGLGEVIEVERPVSRSEPRAVAVLRGIDKISGLVSDIRAPVDEPVPYERLTITVSECREPPADEASDAFAFLKISDPKSGAAPVFSGWMFASSPALSAMDHQRYDVWVLSCATS